MYVIYSGTNYKCSVAVKCENDKYIKLYDENGAEIAAFHHISDFSLFETSGGVFTSPNDCAMPIPLTTYTIGSRTISTDAWILSEDESRYSYEIENELISGNATTCDILLNFASGTELEYKATQEEGKIVLYTDAAPLADVVIDSILITRV